MFRLMRLTMHSVQDVRAVAGNQLLCLQVVVKDLLTMQIILHVQKRLLQEKYQLQNLI